MLWCNDDRAAVPAQISDVHARNRMIARARATGRSFIRLSALGSGVSWLIGVARTYGKAFSSVKHVWTW